MGGGSGPVGQEADVHHDLFNLGDAPAAVAVTWPELGVAGKQQVRDLWKRKNLGVHAARFSSTIPPHGAGLFKLTPLQ